MRVWFMGQLRVRRVVYGRVENESVVYGRVEIEKSSLWDS